MPDNERVLDLLKQAVPLALLFDLAGFAPSSEEILYAETGGERLPAARTPVAVAS